MRSLAQEAARLRRSGKDEKWQRLSETLQLPEMFDTNRNRRKLVLFTEQAMTLQDLEQIVAVVESETVEFKKSTAQLPRVNAGINELSATDQTLYRLQTC